MSGSPLYSAFDSPNALGDVEFVTSYFSMIWKTDGLLKEQRYDLLGERLRSHFAIQE
jgi:hypothetical protein